jgi:hypothetical protein
MLRKPAGNLSEGDLQRLVEVSEVEDDRLDFKREMYGQGDDDRREMIRDIVAMANHRGGLILLGVETDGDDAAIAIPGVEGTDHDLRIRSSAQSNIDPRLGGLAVVPIPLANGRSVIAIGIPESLNGPHMTTFRNENVFWKRHGRQKDKMSAHEVEVAYMRRMDSLASVEAFFSQRRSPPNLESAEQQWFLLQAAPVFMRDELVSVTDERLRMLLFSPPAHAQTSTVRCDAGNAYPALDGLRAEERSGGALTRFLGLQREGYLEFGALEFGHYPSGSDERDFIPSKTLYGFVYSFVHLYRRILEHLEVSTPSLFALTIVRARGLRLAVPARLLNTRDVTWTRDLLEVPPHYASDAQTEAQADQIVRALNDRLWNAFGRDRCAMIREDGSLV